MQNISKLFFINDSPANKISYYHLLFLLFSLPFDFFYSHLIIISFGVHTLLHVNKQGFKSLFKPQMFLLQSAFWVTLICMFYSVYKSEAYTELGRQVVVFLFPVLLSLNRLDLEKYRNSLLLGFSLCCTITVAYLYFDAFKIIRYYHYPVKAVFTPAFTNHNFSDPIEMHATFFSLQVALALVYLLTVLIKPGKITSKLIYGLCCMVLLAGLIQLGSKSVCVALLFAVCLAIPFFTLNGIRRYYFIALCVVIAGALSLLLSRSVTFRERYITSLDKDMSQVTKDEAVEPRLARWQLAVHLIGQAPVIGHGSGSEVVLLKEAYFNKKFYRSYINGLNAHNQYLSFLLQSGIAGLLVYLATLAYGLKLSVAANDVVFLTFLLLVIVVSLSEDLLEVDKGTMFYGLFFSLFSFSANKKSLQKAIIADVKATNKPVQPCYI